MVDAAGYEAAVTAVAHVVDLLRLEAHDTESLEDASAAPDDLFHRAGADVVLLPGSLTAAIVVDAACATRQREIDAEQLARRRADAIAVARANGAPRADVGDPDGRLARFDVPAVHIDVTTGAGIHTTLTADPETAEPVLLVVPVLVEAGSGRMTAVAEVEARTVACDGAAWRAATAERMASLLAILEDPTRGPSIYGQSDPITPPEG
jgi:hypothetical protein